MTVPWSLWDMHLCNQAPEGFVPFTSCESRCLSDFAAPETGAKAAAVSMFHPTAVAVCSYRWSSSTPFHIPSEKLIGLETLFGSSASLHVPKTTLHRSLGCPCARGQTAGPQVLRFRALTAPSPWGSWTACPPSLGDAAGAVTAPPNAANVVVRSRSLRFGFGGPGPTLRRYNGGAGYTNPNGLSMAGVGPGSGPGSQTLCVGSGPDS